MSRAAIEVSCSRARRNRRGVTYVDLLAACVILAIAASGVLAAVSLLARVPRNKRVTEMGVFIGSQEMERLKARTYNLLTKSNTSTVDWYDKNGAWISTGGSAPAGALYKATWTVPTTSAGSGGVDRNGATDGEDLIEIVVIVSDTTGANTYETARTLLTFGGE
jgi:hypothetical protein